MTKFALQPMTEAYAREIIAWRYEDEYAFYNTAPEDLEETIRTFLDPRYAYHVALHADFGFCGFFCYGADAQIPHGDYDLDAVDVGLGLRPDLIGRGLGSGFLQSILDNTERNDSTRDPGGLPWRATIASFNKRSLAVFENVGFKQVASFVAPIQGGVEFVIVMKESESDSAMESSE